MIRERNLEVNIDCDSLSLCTLCCDVLISLTNFTISSFRVSSQVSSSYNESKDEITLDQVREKFFHLCNQKPVTAEESSNNRVE